MHDTDDERRDELPEHELRDEGQTVGGGVMAAGGTAIDRGTGTLDGIAQGRDAAEDDDSILDHGFGGAIEDVVDDDEPPHLATPAVASNPEIDPAR
jgi:hypothetical protein